MLHSMTSDRKHLFFLGLCLTTFFLRGRFFGCVFFGCSWFLGGGGSIGFLGGGGGLLLLRFWVHIARVQVVPLERDL